MASPYTSFGSTPQSTPIFGQEARQIPNHAGGYTYTLDDWKAFERFLILGTEGGTYYVGERPLTVEAATRTRKVMALDPVRAIRMIVEVSDAGRAPKTDPAIFALALAASDPNPQTRALALVALPQVCRIPTHLFHFITFVRQFRGWGRGLKRAVTEWYGQKAVSQLAYQMCKYQARDGWSHADLLRTSHPHTTDARRHALYRWCLGVDRGARTIPAYQDRPARHYEALGVDLPEIVAAFEEAKTATPDQLLTLITQKGLTREMIPTEALQRPEVWAALLPTMPITALLRNLGNLTKHDLLTPLSERLQRVTNKLTDPNLLRAGRVHPFSLLIALKTYARGMGMKGGGAWTPVPAVVEALNQAFYLAFSTVVPSGKPTLYAIDVSGSMNGAVGGLPLTCAEAAAAMALICARTEPNYHIMGFTGDTPKGGWWSNRRSELRDLPIRPSMRLEEVLQITKDLTFGPTDCALPFVWAKAQKVEMDGCVIITDSETWIGKPHPSEALRDYRQWGGRPTRSVVMGMTATEISIADPLDTLSLDVVGLDSATPQVVADFLR